METKSRKKSLAVLLVLAGILSLNFMMTGCASRNAMIIAPPT